MMINYNEICKALAEWMRTWNFSAFVTLTNEWSVRPLNDIPSSYDLKVNNYLAEIEKKLAVPVAALGLNTLSYAGYLHSHFVVLRKDSQSFNLEELRLFEQKWYRQADAQEITRQDTLLEYIASEKHVHKCRSYDYLVFGSEVLRTH